ncbi:MAG: (2Fe-2S) ferredoxin domain-containing protein [Lentisphaeria bacterium]|nr:(2Fe-2S) ferredoxin domain-containing protein [Lentisphaeria bacterium]NQZ70544.1 (2Fe-2S) ferredoxin domain-containing protein [Lentisphaeria bacterium]
MSDEKIQLMVCTGATCTMKGSRDILNQISKLSAEKRDAIDLDTQRCFARCEASDGLWCPCVRVNDEWLIEAQWDDVRSALNKLLDD